MTIIHGIDFDGDEMTLNVPQSILATAELKFLSNLKENLIDRSRGKCTIQVVQDLCSACYCLTLSDTIINSTTMNQLFMMIHYDTRKNKHDLLIEYQKQKKIFGYQIMNFIVPDNFCCSIKSTILVKNGFVQPLTFSKPEIQAMFKAICVQYPASTAVQFISDFSRMMTKYISDFRGLSISLNDISLGSQINNQFQNKIGRVCKLVEEHCFHDCSQKMIGLSACNNIFENNIKSTSFYNNTSNSLSIMINSGAKGKITNLQQLTTCIGQQIVNAQFPEPQTCFSDSEQSVQSTGFISSSYTKGVTSSEQFYLALGGRDGLIDTSLKTAETGYKQRKSQKAMEDIVCSYLMNGSTGVFSRNICLTLHPGFKPGFLNNITLNFDILFLKEIGCPSIYTYLGELQSKVQFSYTRSQFQNMYSTKQNSTVIVQLPFSFGFFVSKYYPTYNTNNASTSTLSTALKKDVENSFNKIQQMLNKSCNIYLQYYLLREVLYFVIVNGIPSTFFELLSSVVKKRLFQSTFQCGDPVGNLCGGFTCRDSTQSTLNSFHNAGAKLVSGIKRARQLTEKQSSIQTIVYVKPKFKKSIPEMQAFAKKIPQRFFLEVFYPINGQETGSNFTDKLIDTIFLGQKSNPKSNIQYIKFRQKNETVYEMYSKQQIVSNLYHQGIVSYFDNQGDLITIKQNKIDIKDLYLGIHGVISCEVKSLDFDFFVINVDELSTIMHLDLDFTTLWSTNPFEMEKYFGINVAVQSMVHELCQNSKGVDARWNQFIANLIFQTGSSLPITSHGMLKAYKVDTISAAAFERPRVVLSNAAFFEGEANTTCSSTASILSVPQYNTGTSSVTIIDAIVEKVKTLKIDDCTSTESFLFNDTIESFLEFNKAFKSKKRIKKRKTQQISVTTLNEELKKNGEKIKATLVQKKKQRKAILEMNKELKKKEYFFVKSKKLSFNEKALDSFFNDGTSDVCDLSDLGTDSINFKMPKIF